MKMRRLLFLVTTMFLMVQGASAWNGSGSSGAPYLIASTADWNTLASNVANGNTYSNTYFKLTADITVTTMVGSYSGTKTFNGTFDGGGHTLTFNYTATAEDTAPFAYLKNATIQNLRVAGTINTGYKFAAGLCVYSSGSTNIEACQISVTINSTLSNDGTYGGLVSDHLDGTLNINNCLFDGQLLGTGTFGCGGFVGWDKTTTNITNSLFAPTAVSVQGPTFSRTKNSNTLSLTNCYYTDSSIIGNTHGYATQGSDASGMTAEALVTALNGSNKNWCIYRGNAIPIMVNLVISTKAQWDNFSSHAGNYENKYVQLNADISNITAMTSGTFQGIFDGNGHTLTVNLTNSGGNVAPFYYLNGGTIMNLTVAGGVTTAGSFNAGLVARTHGGINYIQNCIIHTNVAVDDYGGGVVGHADNASSLTISDCIYDGTITHTGDYAGGFIGWYNWDNHTLDLTMTNCLCKGTYNGNGTFHPIGVKKSGYSIDTSKCHDCYYTTNPHNNPGSNRYVYAGTKVCELSLGDNIIATGSSCTFDGKTYHLGTVSLSYTPSKPTLFYMIDGNEISGNSFTISKDNQAFDAGAVTITAGDTSITYHYGGTNNTILYIDVNNGNSNMVTHPWTSEANYSSITSVVIGNGVTSICGNAFKQCPNLTSASIASTVTSIGNSAFNSCTNLTSVTCWPTTPPTLGTSVFPSTTNIYVPSVNDYNDVGNWSSYYSDNNDNNHLFPISWEVPTNQIASGSFAGYWATFYFSGANMLAPEGVTVYKATRSDSSLSLTEIYDRIITAGKAVILKKETAGSIILSVAASASAGDYSGNNLQGVDKATARETASEYKYYTLANGSKGLGFYRYTGTTLAANKAYIMTVTLNASEYLFSLDEETTGVNDVRSKKDDVRGDYYNLNGQKVPNPTKGLYIVNGKKVIK